MGRQLGQISKISFEPRDSRKGDALPMGQLPLNRNLCVVRQTVAAAARRVLVPVHTEFHKI